LGNGLLIDEALGRNTDPLPMLDEGFGAFATRKARELAPKVDWNAPKPSQDVEKDVAALEQLAKKNPGSYRAHMAHAAALLEEGHWSDARAPLLEMIRLFPDYVGGDNAHELLALVYRELGRESEERRILNEYARLDSAAIHAYLRL